MSCIHYTCIAISSSQGLKSTCISEEDFSTNEMVGWLVGCV